MKSITQSLASLPIAVGMLMASSAANAAIVTPPPPNGVASGSAIGGGATSGVTVCVVPLQGSSTEEVVTLNFFPPPDGPAIPGCPIDAVPGQPGINEFGRVDINFAPLLGPFGQLQGNEELLSDFGLPFFGPTDPGGLALDIKVTPMSGGVEFLVPLVNADASDGDLGSIGEHDTFQATHVESVSLFENAAGNTEASFNFKGKWSVTVDPDTGEIETFHGDLALSQIITSPLSVVLGQLRSPTGLVTSFNLQQTIEAKAAPEPSAMMAMAALGGAGLLARKKRS